MKPKTYIYDNRYMHVVKHAKTQVKTYMARTCFM